MKKLSLAVIGVGRMGSIHAANAARNPRIGLRALVDIDKEKAQQKADALGVPSAYESIDEMLENEKGEIKAAVIATPTSLHVPHALKILKAGYLNAGYRVLLEKPLAPSPDDAQGLRIYLGGGCRKLMHGFQRRFDPAYRYAKRIVDDDILGNIFRIESTLENDGPPPAGYESHGVLVDMGVHLIDLHSWLLGSDVKHIVKRGSFFYPCQSSQGDLGHARMKTELDSGMVSIINVRRQGFNGYMTKTAVYGSDAVMIIHSVAEGVEVKVTKVDGAVKARKRFRNRTVQDGPDFAGRHARAHEAELDYFARRCLQNEGFCVTHIEGLKALNVCYEGQR